MKNFTKLKRRFMFSMALVVLVPILVTGFIAFYNMYSQRMDYNFGTFHDNATNSLAMFENRLVDRQVLDRVQLDTLIDQETIAEKTAVIETLFSSDAGLVALAYLDLGSDEAVVTGEMGFDLDELRRFATHNDPLIFSGGEVHFITRDGLKILVKTYLLNDFLEGFDFGDALVMINYSDQTIYSNSRFDANAGDRELTLVGSVLPLEMVTRIRWTTLLHHYDFELRETISLILIAIMLSLLFIMVFVRHRIEPFVRIRESIERLLKGDYGIRMKVSGPVEQQEISRVFNEMAQEIEHRINVYSEHLNDLIEQNRMLAQTNNLLGESILEVEKSHQELELLRHTNEVLINKFDQLLIRFDSKGTIRYMNEYGMVRFGIEDYSQMNLERMIRYQSDETTASDLMTFLLRYEVREIQIEFIHPETLLSEIMLASTRHLEDDQGNQIIQLVAHELSLSFMIEKTLRDTHLEHEIMRDINFYSLNFDEIIPYFKMIANRLFNFLKPLEVAIIHIEGASLETTALASSIAEYRKFDSGIDQDNVFSRILTEKLPIEIRNPHEATTMFTPYYEMQYLADSFNYCYLHPVVVEQVVTDVIMVVSDEAYPGHIIETVHSIINHLGLAIERVKLIEKLKQTGTSMIRTLTRTIEAKDQYTVGHSERVAEISRYLAKKLGYNRDFMDEIYLAGLLHDIGKLGIQDRILAKDGRLSATEYDKIREHPDLGYQILKNADFSKNILDATRYHHKRFDLTGYPEEEIGKLGIMPAIVGVADALDAIVTDRSYCRGRSIEDAIEELMRYRGTQFDPLVVDLAVSEMRTNRDYFVQLLIDGGHDELSGIIS